MGKILIVEDEKNIRELVKFNLEGAGFKVLTASNGKEALEKISTNIDLVVLDLMLPEIDGMEVCRRLRADENLKKLQLLC